METNIEELQKDIIDNLFNGGTSHYGHSNMSEV